MNDFARYVAIEKVDPDERMVFGRASSPELDSQGDRVSVKAIEDALPEYMRFANIREMHQRSAVGKTKSAEIDEDGLYIGAKIVDDAAWKKVKEGVYSGFSIGGRVTKRKDEEILGLELVEISLVDRPANPNAVIDVWKSQGAQTPRDPEPEPEPQPEESTKAKLVCGVVEKCYGGLKLTNKEVSANG
jgi:HK97 family phage prohead protease